MQQADPQTPVLLTPNICPDSLLLRVPRTTPTVLTRTLKNSLRLHQIWSLACLGGFRFWAQHLGVLPWSPKPPVTSWVLGIQTSGNFLYCLIIFNLCWTFKQFCSRNSCALLSSFYSYYGPSFCPLIVGCSLVHPKQFRAYFITHKEQITVEIDASH